jgi:K+-transporting ATPase ATPase A chain
MTANGWFQIALFFLLIVLIARPLGIYMADVFERRKTFLDPVLAPVERVLYRLTGVDADKEMRWTEYGIAMLLFSLVSMLLV